MCKIQQGHEEKNKNLRKGREIERERERKEIEKHAEKKHRGGREEVRIKSISDFGLKLLHSSAGSTAFPGHV